MTRTSKSFNTCFLLLLLILCSSPLLTLAQSKIQGYAGKGGTTVVTQGLNSTKPFNISYPSCTISVFDTGTATLSTIFSDASSTAKANPFTADSTGYWFFWANNGVYDVQFSGTGITTPFTLTGYKIGDASSGLGGSGTTNRVAKFSASATLASSQITDNATSVGINNTSPAATALLDLTSTTQGFLPPRLTTGQRDAIVSPATGLTVFNTTTGLPNYYSGSAWVALSSGGITSLGGLTGATQLFATSTSGTDFTISSAVATHTFNLPDASATARGLVTTGTQTLAGAKTLSGAVTLGSTLGQAVGGADPFTIPNQVSPFTQKIATAGIYALNAPAVGNVFQISSWARNTGSAPTTAVGGFAFGNGASAEAFGGNFVAYAETDGASVHGAEIDAGNLVANPTGAAHALVLAFYGGNGGTNYIQMQSGAASSEPNNGILFNGTDRTPVKSTGALLTTTGVFTVTNGIDLSSNDFTVSDAAIKLRNGYYIKAKDTGGTSRILIGADASNYTLVQSATTGIRFPNAANTVNLMILADAGGATITGGLNVLNNSSVSIFSVAESTGNAIITGTITAGSSSTVLTNAAGKILSNALNTVDVDEGGTGIASYAVGDIIYASGATTLAKLADVAAGSYLRSGGVTTAPVWSTTTLPNAATTGDLIHASASNTYANLAAVAAGSVLVSAGTSTAPAWSAAPTLTTSLTVPIVYGGSSAGSTLTLQGTSTVGTNAYILMNPVVSGAMPGAVLIGMPAASLPAGGVLGLQNTDNTANAVYLDQYSTIGNLAANIVFRAGRGTYGTSTASQANDPLGIFGVRGTTAANTFATTNNARLGFFAIENFSSTAQGTYITFETTPATTATREEQWRIDDTGNFISAGKTFATLATPANGSLVYCSDCAVTSGADNTCTSGGTGCLAVRLNGVWRCFAAQN